MKKKYKVSVLNNDQEKIIIGTANKEIEADNHDEICAKLKGHGMYITKEGDVIIPDDCNMPPNKYKLQGETFMALGHGYGRPKTNTNGVTKDVAFYHALKALIALCRKMESPVAQECVDYVNYFEENLKKRLDEHLKIGRSN